MADSLSRSGAGRRAAAPPRAAPLAGGGRTAGGGRPETLGLWLLLAAGLLLEASSLDLTWPALAAIVLLGLPHGTLDLLLLRRCPRPGGALAVYLALAGLTALVGWFHGAFFFAVFLAAALWHFGSGDRADAPPSAPALRLLELFGRGSLPLSAPCALAPAATLPLFAAVVGQDAGSFLAVLQVLFPAALAALALASLLRARRDPGGAATLAAEAAAVTLAYLLLPPLAAFAVYFCGLHAPCHWRRVVAAQGRRLGLGERLWVAGVTLGALALPLGAALLATPALPAAASALPIEEAAAVRTLVLLLGALTLPHALLVASTQRDRRPLRLESAPPLG